MDRDTPAGKFHRTCYWRVCSRSTWHSE